MIDKVLDSICTNSSTPDSEYIGEDGLLHCSKCHKAVQKELVIPIKNERRIVRCICDCREKELEADKLREELEEKQRQKRTCFAETNMISWSFENDDKKNEKLSKAMQKYVADFAEYRKQGKGLILYGPCGTGKTYLSACIANALIDKGYTALMTDFTRLSNQIFDTKDGKQKYIDSLNSYSLLVIDDLGAERTTDYMKEMVYNIINTRYKAGLPFIVTTNLTMKEITTPQEIAYARIYDRILERCIPIEVAGVSRRRQGLADTLQSDRAKLGL